MSTIVFGCYFAFLGIMVLLAVRNNAVYMERERVSDYVFRDGNDRWGDDLILYKSISYNEMMFKLWKPVKSFYKSSFPELYGRI